MIERLYLKEMLSFDEVELHFTRGLVVFTGPSGAGKSVLMEGILALFGLRPTQAALAEACVDAPLALEGFEEDEIAIFKSVKKEKVRHFINQQSVPRKQLQDASSRFLTHLNLKECDDFASTRLLFLLDAMISREDSAHTRTLAAYRETFAKLKEAKEALAQAEQEESRIEELKEFAAYEIARIDAVCPKVGEYEQLMEQKKNLSQKEKLQNALQATEPFFELESKIQNALELLEIDTAFWDEALGTLRAHLERAAEELEELDGIDVEKMLDRIEQLSSLKRKYGSIEEALAHRQRRQDELERYRTLHVQKEQLSRALDTLQTEIATLATTLSHARRSAQTRFQSELSAHLSSLRLPGATLCLTSVSYTQDGMEEAALEMGNTPAAMLSSGEFNRLRLCLLALRATYSQDSGGVLILDEIDANVSGEESEGVARLLKALSRYYQVFAISHQPHLPTLCDQHFLVRKHEGRSGVVLLDTEGQIHEIARMVSGSAITQEALEFAKKALQNNLTSG